MNTVSASRLLARRSLFSQIRSTRPRIPITRNVPLQATRARTTSSYEEGESNDRDQGERHHNPYDSVGNYRRNTMEITKLKREMAWLFIGLGATIGATLTVVYMFPIDEIEQRKKNAAAPKGTHSCDSNPADNEAFQGRPVEIAAGGQKKVVVDPQTHEQIELVPTGTSYVPHFPRTIHIPSSSDTSANDKESEYTLVGLGIRRVSFLNVQVYVVGLYVKTTSLATLQASLIHHINPLASALIPGEKENLRNSLLDAEESSRIWENVLRDPSSGIETAFRVVPVRDTNFNHLRDGWVTGLNNKMQDVAKRRQQAVKDANAKSQGDANVEARVAPSEFDDDTMALSMRNFKALFQGRGKAPKGSIILLTRDARGNLDALYQKNPAGGELERIGRVEDERISRLIWLLYLGGKNVSSEEARKDVVQGVMGMVERPVGTVETQVV